MRKIKAILLLGLISISALFITGCELDEAIPFLELVLNFLYLF